MRNYSRKYFLLKQLLTGILFLFLLSSCFQDVIDIDFSEIDSQLVVEGKITNEYKQHEVFLHFTTRYENRNEMPPAVGAIVTITDNEGGIINLDEITPGKYQTPLVEGIPGRTYTLNINHNGEKFTSVSKMPEPILLDSIILNHHPRWDGYEAGYIFRDRPGVTDLCRIEVHTNDSGMREIILYNGRYFEGERIVNENIGGIFYSGDFLNIDVYTIDQRVFDIYFRIANYKSETNVDDIDVNDLLNVSSYNMSNISNNAIGLFSAEAVNKNTVYLR